MCCLLCLWCEHSSFLCYFTNAVMEQSCVWLHLFGGHGFDSLSTGRAKCTWVPSESHNAWKKQSQEPPCHEVPGWLVNWYFIPQCGSHKLDWDFTQGWCLLPLYTLNNIIIITRGGSSNHLSDLL